MSTGSVTPQANGTMIRDHNFAPGNTGYVFWFDILAPVLLIVLYIATG
jgi:hypothetical protein